MTVRLIFVTQILAIIVRNAVAFHLQPTRTLTNVIRMARNDGDGSSAREEVVATAKRLRDQYGVFLVNDEATSELQRVVKRLESEEWTGDGEFLGNWTLLATCSNVNDYRPYFYVENPFRESLVAASNRFVRIQQQVISTENNGIVDRIDNVIETRSPDVLGDIIKYLPDELADIKLYNPFQVTKTTFTLRHKARVYNQTHSKRSLFTTHIDLKSILLHVAGKTRALTRRGRDIFGFYLPAARDFATRANTFETTYLDDKIRISRGRVGRAKQLRVFLRDTNSTHDDQIEHNHGASPSGYNRSDKGKSNSTSTTRSNTNARSGKSNNDEDRSLTGAVSNFGDDGTFSGRIRFSGDDEKNP